MLVALIIQQCACTISPHSVACRLSNIFPHYLIKGMIFGGKKKVLIVQCLLIFSTTFVCGISYSKENCLTVRLTLPDSRLQHTSVSMNPSQGLYRGIEAALNESCYIYSQLYSRCCMLSSGLFPGI